MKQSRIRRAEWLSLALWVAAAAAAFLGDRAGIGLARLPSGISAAKLAGIVACILGATQLCTLGTRWVLARTGRPIVEGTMVGRLYRVGAVFAVIGAFAYGMGKLAAFGAFFGMFGGMLLGWSLQAPVSGFAAWILVSLKRPFRPGDRIQFPNLGLTGDVMDLGPMYTMLDQVGGTVGSEEAVGRFILVPNAMLFSQVVVNYTVTQDAPYMLDEAIIRITFDSDWGEAERILLTAAVAVTGDIIEATGVEPYIRSDLYDYGVYLRLRYQTRVKDRTLIGYEINKRIFESVQQSDSVDMAIPYVYSYRAGVEMKEGDGSPRGGHRKAQDLEVGLIHPAGRPVAPADVDQVARSIVSQGLLQPVIVTRTPGNGGYDLLAGDVRLEACKQLGWKSISAIVVERKPGAEE